MTRAQTGQPGHEHGDGCRELAARLSEYLDAELPPDLVREIESHYHACQRCEEFLQSLDRVRRLGRIVAAPAPPEDRRDVLVEELRARIRDEESAPPSA